MPVTRTSNQHQSPLRRTSPNGKDTYLNQIDVTNISSSEGEGHSSVPRKKDRVLRQKPSVPLAEVIEISSDDEPTASSNVVSANLRRQIKKLKEENARCRRNQARIERELVEARSKNVELKASLQPAHRKLILDASQLEDSLDCEICTTRMWSPHILPECGHTFCRRCIQDWFGTTLSQFKAAHPHYNAVGPNPLGHQIQLIMHNPYLVNNPQFAAYLADARQQTPQYTCPTCRQAVNGRPMENFGLKALVRTIATAAGENSPKKSPAAANLTKGKSRAAPIVRMNSPWDEFFPTARF